VSLLNFIANQVLISGLAPPRLSPLRARTNALSVISALPFTL